MIISRIELMGFSSFRDHTVLECPFGITGIVGVNSSNPEKSNGSGKTSLIMSIVYALYGKGEYDTIQDLINDDVEDMFIKIFFELNNTKYELERGIKKGSSYLNFMVVTSSTTTTKLGKGINDAQEEINKIIGMDYPMFSASIFFEQNMMDKFIDSDSEQRKKYIDKIIGNDFWTNLHKKSAKELKEVCSDIKNIDTAMDQYSEDLKTNKKLIDNKDTLVNVIKTSTQEKVKHEEKLLVLQSTKSATGDLATLKSEFYELSQEIDKLIIQKETYSQPQVDYISIISNLEEKKSKLTALLNGFTKDKNDTKERLSIFENECAPINEQILLHIDEKRKLDNSLIQVSEGSCPKCNQLVSKEFIESNNSEVYKKLDILNTSITVHEDSLNVIKTEMDDLQKEIDELTLSITLKESEIKDTENSISINVLEKASQDKINANMTSFITTITNSIESKQKEKDKIEKEILKFNPEAEAKLQKDISDTKGLIDTLNNSIIANNIELGKILNIESTIQELENKYTVATSAKDELVLTKSKYEIAILGFLNIPKKIFEDSIAEITSEVNLIMKQIYPKFDIKIYEDTEKKTKPLVISCMTETGKLRSYKRLSGGQKTIFNIALRLGFSKVIMNRANTSLQFLVLDEPFGALDGNSRREIKQMFSILTETFKQIFIITHTDDLNDFPNIITVKMDENSVSSL